MTEPEPVANPQAQVTEAAKTPVADLVRNFVEALQRPGARCKVDGDMWGLNVGDECQQEIVRLLSRPAADRGQIVEEIKAIVAKDTAHATVTPEPWKLCRDRCIKPDIWDALERPLSPAPAQTEDKP